MPRVAKKAVKKVKKAEYSASIKILGKLYTSTGSSVREAIENLKVEGSPKGKAVLIVSHGEVKKERLLVYQHLFRLFSASRLMREIALKQVSMMFEGI